MTTPGPAHSLYVHVPFCAQKCDYCAFYSHAADGQLVNRYVSALCQELALVADRVRPHTVFFGGGTPSLLNLRQWEQVFGSFSNLGLAGAGEWTVECNPATVSLDKARLWRENGVTRVSMGVQSLDEKLLDRLGRVHSREMVFKSYDILRQAGFVRINLDLMFAIPGQTLEVWRSTLAEALQMGSEHLSTYEVTYEEDTPLYAELQAGTCVLDDDLACAMYETLIELSASRGFVQYEVSNFAQKKCGEAEEIPAEACRHNVNYWRGGPFVGVGPSAAEFMDGIRTRHWANTTLYCEQLEQGRRAIESKDELPPLSRAGEIAAFGLRMNAGWPYAAFQSATGFDLREHWSGAMDRLVQQGWAIRTEERFRLTDAGLRFADTAGEAFLVDAPAPVRNKIDATLHGRHPVHHDT